MNSTVLNMASFLFSEDVSHFFFFFALHLFDQKFGVLVHGFHEGADVLWLHVRIEAVAQVCDVALGAEARHHLLHDL